MDDKIKELREKLAQVELELIDLNNALEELSGSNMLSGEEAALARVQKKEISLKIIAKVNEKKNLENLLDAEKKLKVRIIDSKIEGNRSIF